MKKLAVVVAVSALVAACSGSDSTSPPSNVAGTYSVSITNTNNDCQYANWTIGNTAQNIQFDVTQNGASASGNVKGLANIYFAVLGIGTLTGNVNGDSASLTAVGTTPLTKGACQYHVQATATFTLTGNTINGSMVYTNQTNNDPSCGTLTTCSSTQSVAGSRPPK
jgi:hypothetical protein